MRFEPPLGRTSPPPKVEFIVSTELLLSALLIFAMRIADVSIGTIRIGMLVRGYRGIAGVLSFFESLLWLFATAQVLTSLDNPVKFIAFASGYAAGTMLGSTIERWLAVGKGVVQIVAPHGSPEVAPVLREHGYYATVMNGEGREGGVRITYSVIPKKKQRKALDLIYKTNTKAFVTFQEINTAEAQKHAMPRPFARKMATLLRH